jgi:transposase InsO family protein
VSSRYEFIDSEKANYPICRMCVWSDVSRSGFYEWRDRPASATTERRAALTAQVKVIFAASRQTYGYRRVQVQLGLDGVEAGPELVRAIMAAEDLVACQPRPWRTTTTPDGTAPPADLLERDFTAQRPGERFVGDITYVRTWAGWLYLATVIDLATKEVVGWSMADHLRTELICDALSMAYRNGRTMAGAVFHSDRGCQYTSGEFATHLRVLRMVGSMGRTGVCWDNALAESFFASLKKELVYRTVFPTRRHARNAIAEYIEVFYNRQRLHSGIGYCTPLQARELFNNKAA